MQGKIANLESVVSVHCITLLDHVIKMRASCFDTDFASQMKLTKLPLIHCFDLGYNKTKQEVNRTSEVH